ncbi:TatD family hydrolase [Herminiimonas sp. CN]|uniref:TatD family hydrolase n=1 Tax=Herminiimonas sp. CN TaxID=1349818 RepID=UPI000474321A|nr:TatD family hydrolase [Herminiimonas sp. CN]
MWTDSHCHLDAPEFGADGGSIAQRAAQLGVGWIVIPAVATANFAAVAALAHRQSNCAYALGIHPIFVPQAQESDLAVLRQSVAAAMADSRLVAIGEIGLDFFVPELKAAAMAEKQTHFYREQLKIARDFGLPVLLHARRAQDLILKQLRAISVPGGIAHAFNGSLQQAQAFIDLGFKLGFGGALTFPRALQLRRLAANLPLEAIVLETDAPDMAPVWLHPARNSPQQLPRIGQLLAELRGQAASDVARITSANVLAVLPRLAHLAGAAHLPESL